MSLTNTPGAPIIYGDSLLPHKEAWLSVQEFSKVCRVSDDTIYRAIQAGELKYARVKGLHRGVIKRSGVYRIERSSALVYLVRNGIATPEQAYREVENIVSQWPPFMKLNLIKAIKNEHI